MRDHHTETLIRACIRQMRRTGCATRFRPDIVREAYRRLYGEAKR